VAARGDRHGVLQLRAHDLPDRRQPVAEGQRVAAALGEEQVLVRVYAAAEIEIGAGVEGQAPFAEDAELEDSTATV
jgi:hypothetical protein